MSTPEAALNTLRKLDANKACANCDAVAKFGHGNICEKFKTFVCNHCKSAHQSYSHRVKSVTMSNWTKEDVDALKEENGGGNSIARRTWLATWEEGRSIRKPLETDHLDLFKKFINAVYNDKAYYAEAAPQQRTAPRQPAKTAPPTSSIVSSASTSGDLLGFSPPSSTSALASSSSFEANFDSFSAPVAPAATAGFAQFDAFSAPPAAPAYAAKHDEWAAFQSAAPATTAAATSFDPFGATPAAQPSFAAPPATSFDPFAAVAPTQRPPQPFNAFGQPPTNGFGAPVANLQPAFNQGFAQPGPATNITYSGGGGASISSLLDPTFVANPHLQHQRSFGAPQQQAYSAYPQQPNHAYHQPYQQQGGYRPQQAGGVAQQTSGGRDPFAGLAFK